MSVNMRMKILLVEDSTLTRKMEVNSLKEIGFTNIIDAEDGKYAIEKLAKEDDVGLIISDWNMPNKNGYELLKWVRTSEKWKKTPFIMATAQGEKKVIIKAEKAGVSNIISKPFSSDELKKIINETFENIKKGTVQSLISKSPNTLIPKKSKSGKLILNIAHIQITDHLTLGVLKYLIDTGELSPKKFVLETRCLQGWNPVQKSLENGDVEAAFILAPIAMDLFSFGVPVKMILLAHKNGSISVRNTKCTINDLEKKEIARAFTNKIFYIPHILSIHHMLSNMYMREIGLSPGLTDNPNANLFFEVVPPIKMPEFIAKNSDVGGFTVAEPLGSKAIAAGNAELLFLSGQLWENHPCCVVAMRDEIIKSYPDAVQEFTDMLVYSGDFIANYPDSAANIAVDFLDPQKKLGLKSSVLQRVLKEAKGIKTDDLFPIIEDFERIQQYMVNNMNMGTIIDLNEFIDTQFAKNSCKNRNVDITKSNVYDIPGAVSKILSQPKKQSLLKPENKDLPPIIKSNIDSSNTIRIQVGILDKLMRLAGEFVLVRNRQLLSVNQNDMVSRSTSQRLDIVTTELQETVMKTRVQTIGTLFEKFPRIVREVSKRLNKKIKIYINGGDVEVDMSILDSLADPLTNIILYCCDIGIESLDQRILSGKAEEGTIEIKAFQESDQIIIEIMDDGMGLSSELIKKMVIEAGYKTESELARMSEQDIFSLATLPGVSQAKTISAMAGRNVGLDVIKTDIESLGGSVEINSVNGKRTVFHLQLPITLVIIPCLIVKEGKYRYAIPQNNIEEIVCLYDADMLTKIEYAGDNEIYRLRKKLLYMTRLFEILKRPDKFNNATRSEIVEHYRHKQREEFKKYISNKKKWQEDQFNKTLNFAVLKCRSGCFGLIIDSVIGAEEIVVNPMHMLVKNIGIYSGSTVMGDGKVALILNVDGIARHAHIASVTGKSQNISKHDEKQTGLDLQTVLLFKYGKNEHFALALSLIKRIEKISIPNIQKIGNKEHIIIDNISIRVLRLDTLLPVSKCEEKNEMFLLLPKNVSRPIGILISKIIDIYEVSEKLNVESYMLDGLQGTSIINNNMTLFIDVLRIVEMSENSKD
ncbi:chemotaxis protein CheA [Candidatus Magnetomorum sp. HK-1]|nr:chemotaxis protein CheA [Candidatus Magnetomorum sp. HK-1]